MQSNLIGIIISCSSSKQPSFYEYTSQYSSLPSSNTYHLFIMHSSFPLPTLLIFSCHRAPNIPLTTLDLTLIIFSMVMVFITQKVIIFHFFLYHLEKKNLAVKRHLVLIDSKIYHKMKK